MFDLRRECVWLSVGLVALCLLGCRSTISADDVAGPDGAVSEVHSAASRYFRAPLLSRVSLSPDGQNIAAVMAKGGTEIVLVKPTFGPEIKTLAKIERTRRRASWAVRTLGWASNSHLVVGVEMPSTTATRVRARQSRLMVVPINGEKPRYIGEKWRYQEFSGIQDRVVSWLPDDPDHILLNLWLPGDSGMGARRVNIHTGQLVVVGHPAAGMTGWAADSQGHVRVGWGEPRSRSERFLYGRAKAKGALKELVRWNPNGESGLSFAGFSPDPNVIYVTRYTDLGTLGIYSFDLEAGALGPLVFGHPEYDAGALIQSEQDDRLLGVRYDAERPEIHFVDERERKLREDIDAALPNRTNEFVSSDRRRRYAIVYSSGAEAPPSYYFFDRGSRKLLPLFDAYPELTESAEHAAMEAVTYPARDGLSIHGYVTRPLIAGKGPHPTIVVPHGGPWSRDVWGWDPQVQFLANRGFVVFQPNFRGSTGYGGEFLERGFGGWALEMQDDITDGVDWLIANGIADPDRIGIFGTSYGGFAALQALMKEPGKFKAGASYAGVTDIPTLLADDASYRGLLDDMERLVGDRWSDRKHLRAISPARNADKMVAPVLIGHGTEDWRVHVKQAYAMIDAIEAEGGEVESRIYEGEVHGFLDERNEIDFYVKLAEFFEHHLDAGAAASAPSDKSLK